MPKFVLRDTQVVIDRTNLSNRSNTVNVTKEDEELDSTAFTAKSRQREKGIPDASIAATFFQDFGAGSTHQVLNSVHKSADPVPVLVIPTDAEVSETNPAFLMREAHMFGYTPLGGSVGELSTTEVTFQNAGEDGIEEITDPQDVAEFLGEGSGSGSGA